MDTVLNVPIYAATLGGCLLAGQGILAFNVGLYRTQVGKAAGVENDIELERRVRRHGNLAENAAIFVATLTLYELVLGQTGFALALAIVFGAARLLHIIGFSNKTGSHGVELEGSRKVFMLMRASGAGLSALTSIVLGGALVFAVVL